MASSPRSGLSATKDAMDEVLAQVEDAFGRTASNMVKQQALLIDIIPLFGIARDLIQLSLSDPEDADRTHLLALFGDCSRVARLRVLLEMVRSSPRFEIVTSADERPQQCLDACEALEGVLGDLGLASNLRQKIEERNDILARKQHCDQETKTAIINHQDAQKATLLPNLDTCVSQETDSEARPVQIADSESSTGGYQRQSPREELIASEQDIPGRIDHGTQSLPQKSPHVFRDDSSAPQEVPKSCANVIDPLLSPLKEGNREKRTSGLSKPQPKVASQKRSQNEFDNPEDFFTEHLSQVRSRKSHGQEEEHLYSSTPPLSVPVARVEKTQPKATSQKRSQNDFDHPEDFFTEHLNQARSLRSHGKGGASLQSSTSPLSVAVVRVEILSARAAEDNVIWYSIRVINSGTTLFLHKRYSDFKWLHESLSLMAPYRTLPELPPPGIFGIRHRLNIGTFNEKRYFGLEAYLEELIRQVKPLSSNPALAEFLGRQPR